MLSNSIRGDNEWMPFYEEKHKKVMMKRMQHYLQHMKPTYIAYIYTMWQR